jgi:hypothetical protein
MYYCGVEQQNHMEATMKQHLYRASASATSNVYPEMDRVLSAGRRTSAVEVNRILKSAGMVRMQVSTTRIRGWNNVSMGDFRCVREKAHGTWGDNGPDVFLNIICNEKNYERVYELLVANGIEVIMAGNGFIWVQTV